MKTSLTDFSIDQLRRAIALKEQIEALETELSHVLLVSAPSISTGAVRGRRKRSAAARAKMAAAQRARWAKLSRGTAGSVKPVKKRRGKLSPEGRARIIAAQKARWAKAKAKQGK